MDKKATEIQETKEPSSETKRREKLIELANSDQSNKCSYSDGYITQAVYSCLTCQNSQKEGIGEIHKKELREKYQSECDPAAVCLGCAINCHEDHDLVFVHRKPNIRCDCGNSKMLMDCKLNNQKDFENEKNIYCHNYFNKFCNCNENYEGEQFMIQCEGCFQWFHLKHSKIEKCQERLLRRVHQIDVEQISIKQEKVVSQKQNLDNQKNSSPSSTCIKRVDDNKFGWYEEIIQTGLFFCVKCKQQKIQRLEGYLGIWKFLTDTKMRITELYDILFFEQQRLSIDNNMMEKRPKYLKESKESKESKEIKESKESQENTPIQKKKQPQKCIIKALESLQTQEPKSNLSLKDLSQLLNQNQSLQEETAKLNNILLSKIRNELLPIPNTSIIISRSLTDYCTCEDCQTFLKPLLAKLIQNQIEDFNVLLEEINQDYEEQIKSLPINELVGQFSQSMFNKIQNQNNEELPVTVKHLAMNHFKNIFEEMKVYIESGQESIETKQGMQNFLSQVKSKSLAELYEEQQQKILKEQQQDDDDDDDDDDDGDKKQKNK